MKISDIDSNERQYLKISDLENLFDVSSDDTNYFYNLNASLYLNISESLLKELTLNSAMFWTTISYKLYNTTRLAWLLMKLNKVEAKDIFTVKQPGDKIVYLDTQYVNGIIERINQ